MISIISFRRINNIRVLGSFVSSTNNSKLCLIDTSRLFSPEIGATTTLSRHIHRTSCRITSVHDKILVNNGDSIKTPNYETCDELNFERHSDVFRDRKFGDIVRSLIVLKVCGIDVIARNSLWLMQMSRQIIGKRLYEKLMKSTFYGHFVAGSTETCVSNTVGRLRDHGIRAIIQSTMEETVGDKAKGEEHYDSSLACLLDCIRLSQITERDCPMAAVKITGLVSSELLLKISLASRHQAYQMVDVVAKILNQVSPFETMTVGSLLNKEEQLRLSLGIQRLNAIGKAATAGNVVLLMDAEYTNINLGISILTLAMMKAFNKSQPLIWNTYQCYLKNAYKNFVADLELIKKFDVCFGAKIVRGAYMDQERDMANKNGIPDPINPTFHYTTSEYHKVADHMFEEIHKNPEKCRVIFGSHNHETVTHISNRMKSLGMMNNDRRIYFGQVFGISDHVSYTLSRLGYNVYKVLPWGAVSDVMPYLYRRAMENKAVLYKTKFEIKLLKQEIMHRIKSSF